MRQIVLDTETTGLEPLHEHSIVEIGCVELLDRRLTGRTFQQYIKPPRDIEARAMEVHGITLEQLENEPRFAQIADKFLQFVDGAELIIHNASFDVGIINVELARLVDESSEAAKYKPIDEQCAILDTMDIAKDKHPGQRNSLDALCQRYGVDNSQRELHGALLDAEILADVYLALTGGQAAFELGAAAPGAAAAPPKRLSPDRAPLPIIRATEEDLRAHESFLDRIAEECDGEVLWRKLGS